MNLLDNKKIAFSGITEYSAAHKKSIIQYLGGQLTTSPQIDILILGRKPNIKIIEKAKLHNSKIIKINVALRILSFLYPEISQALIEKKYLQATGPNFSYGFEHYRTNFLYLDNIKIHESFQYFTKQKLELEIELVSCSNLKDNFLFIYTLFSENINNGHTNDQLVLRINKANQNQKIILIYQPVDFNEYTPPTQIMIKHVWGKEINSSLLKSSQSRLFNFAGSSGEIRKTYSGNSAMIIEKTDQDNEFLVKSNSGDHSESEKLTFTDAIFKVKITLKD